MHNTRARIALVAFLAYMVLVLIAGSAFARENAVPRTPPFPGMPGDPTVSDSVYPYTNRVVVLMYHHVAPVAETGSTISTDRFREQMEYLRDGGFNVVSMKAFTEYLEGRGVLPPKAVLITFDDGYESLLTDAYPVLREFGFPATCFAVVADTGIVAEGGTARHLSWDQMLELQRTGLVTFGSHTYDQHGYIPTGDGMTTRPALTAKAYDPESGVTESEADFEKRVFDDLLLSKRLLEQHLGTTVDTIAFPYGAAVPETRELAARAGFRFMFGIRTGVVGRRSDWSDLTRINAGSDRITNAMLDEAISASVFESMTTLSPDTAKYGIRKR